LTSLAVVVLVIGVSVIWSLRATRHLPRAHTDHADHADHATPPTEDAALGTSAEDGGAEPADDVDSSAKQSQAG
ncbi:MAG: hypothetical protein ACH36H_06330, partial [Candidatus Nanopelagicales bacterium]